ncbi:MAG: AbrB family transcriptional regulator [Thermoprotei archaeon]|nr:MAG: AbrB family transcriptional regulator [Thermoprotei archaeon]RLF22580.1 MAG: AbrB family transcriptional regulator [Thermoprotei archaeon]
MIKAYAKVTRNFQVTIPLEIREKLGVKEGDMIVFIFNEESGKVYMTKVVERRLRLRANRKLTPEEIERIIERGLGECMK